MGLRALVIGVCVMAGAQPAVPGAAPQAVVVMDTLPTWAQARWRASAQAKTLVPSARLSPAVMSGDFDGDGERDVALFVARRDDRKEGIVFIHRRARVLHVVGAGRELGNGGDDFSWADTWRIERGAGRADVVVLERESSGSGVIAFRNGRYRWRQRGD